MSDIFERHILELMISHPSMSRRNSSRGRNSGGYIPSNTMQLLRFDNSIYCAGSLRVILASLALVLLAHSASAQAPATIAAPVITTVTPGDSEATIGFAPPPIVNGLPIREYVVSCDQVGNPTAGTIEGEKIANLH